MFDQSCAVFATVLCAFGAWQRCARRCARRWIYEDSAEARAERAEAEVAALMEKIAELNATVGELKGENKVLREHSERLFAMLEARPKQ